MTDFPVPVLRPGDTPGSLRNLAAIVSGVMRGQTNNVGTVTLTANQATTVVSDRRAGPDSHISLTPTTANAAAEIGAGTAYISARGDESFTITHANNAQTDRTFTYAVIG